MELHITVHKIWQRTIAGWGNIAPFISIATYISLVELAIAKFFPTLIEISIVGSTIAYALILFFCYFLLSSWYAS